MAYSDQVNTYSVYCTQFILGVTSQESAFPDTPSEEALLVAKDNHTSCSTRSINGVTCQRSEAPMHRKGTCSLQHVNSFRPTQEGRQAQLLLLHLFINQMERKEREGETERERERQTERERERDAPGHQR